ncbi:MAG TPA: hypothetical protein VFV73_07420 [Streptosporangiaceae bacterium]|nr:hypothetical protein [Streptosporangiaceae bacterium]
MIRDITETRRAGELAGLAAAAVAAEQAHQGQELLDTTITSLFHVGLSLQAAIDLPAELIRQRITEALGHLDDTIREIRNTAFTIRHHDDPLEPRCLRPPPDGNGRPGRQSAGQPPRGPSLNGI